MALRQSFHWISSTSTANNKRNNKEDFAHSYKNTMPRMLTNIFFVSPEPLNRMSLTYTQL